MYTGESESTSRTLGDLVTVGVPVGGEYFFGLDREGRVHGWRSADLEPLTDLPGALCAPAAVEPGKAPGVPEGDRP